MPISRRTLGLVGLGAMLSPGLARAQEQGPPGGQAPGGPPRGLRPDPYAGKKKVLFIADTSTGNQVAHDSTTHAMAAMEKVLRDAGIVVFDRTDMRNVTKGEVWGKGDYVKGGKKQSKGRNLDFFDAVVFYVNGEPDLDDQQRQDLLDFLAKDGKGFVGIHTATSAGYYWPEYGKMIGGYFDNHPWNTVEGRMIVERLDFPGMSGFVANPVVKDELYAMTAEPFSRKDVDVLMRLDPASVDMTNPQVHRTDKDFPQAWIKSYGKGRVFYSALGHPDAAWDDPRVQTMYLEAIKWAVGLTTYPVRPHPIP
jgi:type 1 glutamine amidotransferase